MKKLLTLTVAALVMMITLAGCGTSSFALFSEDGVTMHLEAENASKDTFITTGTLSVGEGEEIYIEAAFKSGEVNFKFIPALEGEDLSIDEIENAAEGIEPTLEVTVGKDDIAHVQLPAGDYYVSATVTKKLTGTAELTVQEM